MKLPTALLIGIFVSLLSGCDGSSALPAINFIGKTRSEVVAIFAEAPRVLDNDINIKVPIGKHDNFNCGGNLYFKTPEEALANEQVRSAPYLGGYQIKRRAAVPGGWDYYVVSFGPDGRVDKQAVVSCFDGP